ncbi:hypothetical protein SEMRO_1950_G307380.1 [Seminavis robusta]|uniref:Uncharacterized protein n=1 Tax=Seminavis robusta TaxID=568900 RepID=A0A9N8EUX0_9STRA|nr:hypothetical protein SEMRO_1950_G307380.1 [Seminavis robusta]|eukprot:Sro1950_g307380.1 n/a (807) ;mRNA; f:13622-16194
MNSLWSPPNINEEEEEITVPNPNSVPADSPMTDISGTAFDPFRSQMLLSTRTSLAAPDGPMYPFDVLAEAGAMEGGDKKNDDDDEDDDDDDPFDDPKKNNGDDDAGSESPSNLDFSISSMDIERGIHNSAIQYVAFEAMYSAAYDVVYGACMWPRLLLSYCLGMFGLMRKKNNDADGPLPPEDNNHVQDMALAASQSAAIGIGAGVMASQSAAAGAGASSMTAAVSTLSTPTKIGIIVTAAITVAATTAGIAAGISGDSDNIVGPCAGRIEATDVKQGVVQIAFSSSYISSTVDTPATGELLLQNKNELEDTFAQVYNNVTANSTNGGLVDPCDIPRIPTGGVQLMQVESSEGDNFTNTFWVADVHCNGCTDTDPLFGTNTEGSPELDLAGTVVDDFVDQFTQAIQPILTTNDPTQETDPMTSPPQPEQQDPPKDVLFVALVDPMTGERLPEQPQQMGPGDMIEAIPSLDTVWNENTIDAEQDRLVPGSPSSAVASAPTTTTNTGPPTATDANLPTATTSTESKPTPTAAAPTNTGITESSSNNEMPNVPPAAGSGVSNQGATIGPTVVSGQASSVATNPIVTKQPSGNAGTFAPAATSPSFSMANKDQVTTNDNQQQEPGPTYKPKSLAPATSNINLMLPSFVISVPTSTSANGNTSPSVAQPMTPFNVDQTNTQPTASVPAPNPNRPTDVTVPQAPKQAPSPAGIPNIGPVSPNAKMPTTELTTSSPATLGTPTKDTLTMVPTSERMLSPETCAGMQMFAGPRASSGVCNNINKGGGNDPSSSRVSIYPTISRPNHVSYQPDNR